MLLKSAYLKMIVFFPVLVVLVGMKNTYSQSVQRWEFPEEKVSVMTNEDIFITGETLRFKVHCRSPQRDSPWVFSQVVYIELVGKDGNAICQTKVGLDKGVGAGDWAISTAVPSGNYTLIAYTKWMKNFSHEDFFRQEITIINPIDFASVTRSKQTPRGHKNTVVTTDYAPFRISLNKNAFKTRDLVQLQVSIDLPDTLDVLVNVRQANNRERKKFNTKYAYADSHDVGVKHLPDLRGELLSGTLTTDGKPAEAQFVFLAVPSEYPAFMISLTDSTGRFFFNTDYTGSNLIHVGLLNDTDRMKIDLDDPFLVDHRNFVPSTFIADSAHVDIVNKRLVSVQIENAFEAVKRDSTIDDGRRHDFFGSPDRTYNLDDFTRFPTLEDVFREIVPEVVVRKRDEKFSLSVMNLRTGYRLEGAPLTLIDGIPVADATAFMSFPAEQVKRVLLIAQPYLYCGLRFSGIISLETFLRRGPDLVEGGISKAYEFVQQTKAYNSPDYSGDHKLQRVPDYRTQLYWNPSVRMVGSKPVSLQFFTNDIAGEYEIEVIGVGLDGSVLIGREIITVEDR